MPTARQKSSMESLLALVRARDVDWAVAEFERDWMDLLFCSHHADLQEFLTAVPLSRLRSEAGLRFAAVATGRVSDRDAWHIADEVFRIARSGTAEAEEFVQAHLLAAARLRRIGEHRQAHRLFERIEPVARQLEERGDAPDLVILVAIQCAMTSLLWGDLAAARSLLTSANELPAPRSQVMTTYVRGLLALLHAVAGEGPMTDTLLDRIDADLPAQVTEAGAIHDVLHLVRLIRALDRCQMTQVERMVRERPAARYGELWPLALWAHTQYLLLTGRHDQGLLLLVQAEERRPEELAAEGLARDVLRSSRADLNAGLGNLREAWVAVEPGTSRGRWSAVSEAVVLYCSGEFHTVRYAARVARTSHELTPRDQVRLRAVEAAAGLELGHEREARDLLSGLAAAARRRDWPGFATHLPRPLVVEAAAAGVLREVQFPSGVAPWIPEPVLAAPLSPREREVLQLLVAGERRTAIAAQLGVSINTIKTQIRGIYAKLRVASRPELLHKVSVMPPGWTYEVLE